MSGILKSSDLIRSIRRRGMIPSDQNTFEDEDFLEMLNEEILYFGAPHLLRTHEEYLLVQEDFTLDGSRDYEIPARALGNKLREISFVTSVGLDENEQIYELSRISVDDLPDYNNYLTSRYSQAFYVQGNKIRLLGEVPESGSVLRMHYYLKPNSLVLEKFVGQITAIDSTTGVVSVDNFPDDFSLNGVMDFVKAKSPNNILGYDVTPTSSDANTKSVTFNASDLPDDLVVGDYLCLAGQTPVPQLPAALHAVLAQRVVVAALEALGDQQGLISAQRRLEMMEKATNDLIDNRVEGAPEKITNRHGTLRAAALTGAGRRNKGRF